MGYDFCQIKIQVAEIVTQHFGIKQNAAPLAIYRINQKFDGKHGNYATTDAQLSEELGVHSDTIARRVKLLMQSGLFDIKRGRLGRQTTYRLKPEVWSQASAMRAGRGVPGTSAGNRPGKAPGLDPANERNKTRQSSGVYKSKILIEGRDYPAGLDLSDLGGLKHEPSKSHSAEQFFREARDRLGLSRIFDQLPKKMANGIEFVICPVKPVPRGDVQAQHVYVQQIESLIAALKTWTAPTPDVVLHRESEDCDE